MSFISVLNYKMTFLLIICTCIISTMAYTVDNNNFHQQNTNQKMERLEKYKGLPFEEKLFRMFHFSSTTEAAFPDYQELNEVEDEPRREKYYNAHQYGPYIHNELESQN